MTIFLLFLPTPALAQVFGADGSLCSPATYGNGLVSRIVNCVQYTMIGQPGGPPGVLDTFLIPLSTYVADAVAVASTLAVIFYGLKMLISAHQKPSGEFVVMLAKIFFVGVYSYDLGGLFPQLVQIMSDLMTAVSQYVPFTNSCGDVWQNMDCALDRLIGGILPGSTLASGVLGLLAGVLVSGPAGVSIAMMGIWMVLFIVNAMFKAVYVYLSAIIGMMFMAIISPIMVPCVLFQLTRPYFDKWLRLFMGLMLQPIFLAAYVTMLLVTFQFAIFSGPQSLYGAITGGSGVDITDPNFSIGGYLAASGAEGQVQRLPLGVLFNPGEAASQLSSDQETPSGMFGQQAMQAVNQQQEQNEVNKLNTSNSDAGFSIPVNEIDMGVLAADAGMGQNPTGYIINVVMALLQAAVMAYIFYTMQSVIPYLGTAIAGGVAGGIAGLPNMANGFDNLMGRGNSSMRMPGEAAQEATRSAAAQVGTRRDPVLGN